MAYAVRRRSASKAERGGFAERSKAAAKRALALDDTELRALAALEMLKPLYGNWQAAEGSRRAAMELHPTFPIHIFLLSDMLGSVGRWREAADVSEKADRIRFLIPGADRKVIVNLWAAGDLQGADTALSEAVDRWPEHPQVWRTRVAYLMFSGRPSEALELLKSAERPAAVPAGLIEAATLTAQALAGTAAPSAAVSANLAYLRDSPGSVLQVAHGCTAVGDAQTAISLLRGYYFRKGEWAELAPPVRDDRYTAPLFLPPMRTLWNSLPFERLLEGIGLNEYWHSSRTLPDYRRVN